MLTIRELYDAFEIVISRIVTFLKSYRNCIVTWDLRFSFEIVAPGVYYQQISSLEKVFMGEVLRIDGRLTRGMGMNEVHRLVWLLGMSACFRVNLSQQTFTGVQYQYSEQYTDIMGKTSNTRNMNDTCRLRTFYNKITFILEVSVADITMSFSRLWFVNFLSGTFGQPLNCFSVTKVDTLGEFSDALSL